MSHLLTLEVPDDVFANLESEAASMGVEVADYCLIRLKNEAKIEDDPFWKAAGCITAEAPHFDPAGFRHLIS